MSKLSVLMPCKNLDKNCRKSINSILEQNVDLELIITIDGGENNLEINDSRVVVKVLEKNLGPSAAINNCYSFATGDYITVHDDDDWSEPGRYKALLDRIGNNRAITSTITVAEGKKFYTKIYDTKNFVTWNRVKSPAHHCAVILRRDLWNEIGPYNENYIVGDSVRMIKLGIYLLLSDESFVSYDKPLYNYIVREGGLSSQRYKECKHQLNINRIKIYKNHSAIFNNKMTPGRFIEWCRQEDF